LANIVLGIGERSQDIFLRPSILVLLAPIVDACRAPDSILFPSDSFSVKTTASPNPVPVRSFVSFEVALLLILSRLL